MKSRERAKNIAGSIKEAFGGSFALSVAWGRPDIILKQLHIFVSVECDLS